ncbi:PP2C family protein-serine/threonine phosphatase [Isoptericola aurantiacus]|uniref:PP2C family protein-serine/threonine phosphatase n=1 Tax=Isoptericola aurantiacus TaxID=3377839 RepID=UPI00383B09D1
MTAAPQEWPASPAGLARLDADGYVLAANDTLLGWVAPPEDAEGAAHRVLGRRVGDLLTAGGRIYWDTHVVPTLVLAGTVESVALGLRTAAGTLPVMLTARTDAAAGTVEVAMMAVRERAEFHQTLMRSHAAAERWAERLRWVQDATAALSRAVGVPQVRDALLDAVARHPSVAAVALRRPLPDPAPDGAPQRTTPGRIVVAVVGASGSHGDLVVTTHDRAGDASLDVDALGTIAQQGAVALDRAHLHEQNASVAHELQHAMLTVDLPRHPGLRMAAEYRPAERGLEVGGDWYDAFWLDTTRVAVVIGDVVGHGLAAATAMGQLRTATRALAAPDCGPEVVVDLVDRFVADRHVGFGSTVAYGVLDLESSRFSYACAGHLPPLLVRATGGCEFLRGGRSTPLGVRAVGARTRGQVRLDPGDTVLLYTDGVVERRDQSLPDGLNELALAAVTHARAGTLGTGIVQSGGDGRDDACVLALTWGAPPA